MSCVVDPVSITMALMVIMGTNSVGASMIHGKEHKTHLAAEKGNDLMCFVCDSMDVGERCIDLSINNVSFKQKCSDDRRTCMVKQYSYSTTTTSENSTSMGTIVRLWSLERNCTSKCEAGCIIIGERTKLYACTTCCDKQFCNIGRGGAPSLHTRGVVAHLLAIILMLYHWT